jgi:hypothetical protein
LSDRGCRRPGTDTSSGLSPGGRSRRLARSRWSGAGAGEGVGRVRERKPGSSDRWSCGRGDAAVGEHAFQVMVADRELQVPTHRPQDHLGRAAGTLRVSEGLAQPPVSPFRHRLLDPGPGSRAHCQGCIADHLSGCPLPRVRLRERASQDRGRRATSSCSARLPGGMGEIGAPPSFAGMRLPAGWWPRQLHDRGKGVLEWIMRIMGPQGMRRVRRA